MENTEKLNKIRLLKDKHALLRKEIIDLTYVVDDTENLINERIEELNKIEKELKNLVFDNNGIQQK